MNRQTQETIRTQAARYSAGIALLSNPSYKFNEWHLESGSFFVHNGKGDCYKTSSVLVECSCPDFEKSKQPCKHIHAVEELMKQKAQIAQAETYLMEEANAEDAEWGCCPL